MDNFSSLPSGIDLNKQAEVHRACASLVAKGQPVTNEAVRAITGGSYSTIGPHVKSFKASQRIATVAPDQTGLPADLVEAIQQLHTRLQHAADEKVALASAEVVRTEAKAHAELAAAAAREASLAQENATLKETLATIESTVRDLTERDAENALSITRLSAENIALEQRLADRAADLFAAKEQIERAQQRYLHMEERTTAQLREEREAAVLRYEKLLHAHEQLRTRSASMETALQVAEALTTELRDDVARGRDAVGRLQAIKEELELSRAKTASELRRSEMDASAVRQRLEQLVQELSELRLALAGKEGEAKILQRDLHRVQNLYDRLAQEQVIWRQERSALEDLLRERNGDNC